MLALLFGKRSQPPERQLTLRAGRRIMRGGIRRELIAMQMKKRESWSEDDVRSLPQGEHDYFERKSAGWLTQDGFREDLCKAISAFANSGGGQLIIGVSDDGKCEGVEPKVKGRTPTREWLEQLIPGTVSPPLADFRVHEVTPATPSDIPAGRVVLVVEIADSPIAPHQAESGKIYFYRQAGHSARAPHFYLEALRNRLLGPVLTATLQGIKLKKVYSLGDKYFVEAALKFRVTNNGTGAAYRWAVFPQTVDGPNRKRLMFNANDFPRRDSAGSISLDDTILPSMSRDHDQNPIGFYLTPGPPGALLQDLTSMFTAVKLGYRVVSEISAGEVKETPFSEVVNVNDLATEIIKAPKVQ